MLFYVDGPEKAGKSTLCSYLEREHGFRVRHWGKWSHHSVQLAALKEDLAYVDLGGRVVWDRGWLSESAYGHLLQRDEELAEDPWLGQWLYGRAFTAGVVVYRDPRVLWKNRTPDDLPVDTRDEVRRYKEIAALTGTPTYLSTPAETKQSYATRVGNILFKQHYDRTKVRGCPAPVQVGPAPARVAFVGEKRSSFAGSNKGAWLPFTSRYTERYGRLLGAMAFQCSWTNAWDCDPVTVRSAELLVACGERAQKWASRVVDHGNILNVPHPSWLYRWGKADGEIGAVEERILAAVTKVLG